MTDKARHWISLSPIRHLLQTSPTVLMAAAALLAAVITTSAQETTSHLPHYTVLYTFSGGTDGANPNNIGAGGVGLIHDEHGNLYDAATFGGDIQGYCAPNDLPNGCGVLFKLDEAGKEQVLHTFTGPDGANPGAAPVLDDAGNLYGTTNSGGTAGVVFKLDTTGKETVLHNFSGGTDGNTPYAGVIRDEAGKLYGTTTGGGAFGQGVVFEVDAAGTEHVLYSFQGHSDGAGPLSGLIRDHQGNLYGTTFYGGGYGAGIVFRIDPAGNEKILYRFRGNVDGGHPAASLVHDGEGNLYGTASSGGDLSCSGFGYPGCGVVFKLTPGGKETVLHAFTGRTDGAIPYGGLLRRHGNLYGTTFFGGDLTSPLCFGVGCGVVFKLDCRREETVLHAFTGGEDGANPYVSLTADQEGNLFGTTGYGGDIDSTAHSCAQIGCGVVFKLVNP